MLPAKDCSHVTAKDWAGIFSKIIDLKDGEKLLVSISDGHEGGATSHVAEVKPVINGLASHADIVLLNGDDFEYESPAALTAKAQEIKKRYPRKKEYKAAIRAEAEDLLYKKVDEDIVTLTEFIRENPDRKIVKVIGNHENFDTFRDKLKVLEKQFSNFQWVPEIAIIPMPGGKGDTHDTLLATHGDLQMDDLWFVEEGDTDKERKRYTHKDMAKKAAEIATSLWTPSAQKQEKSQGLVNWWRKPNATAKTLYTELLYRAQEGDFKEAIDPVALQTTKEKLIKRRKKFEEFKSELEERKDITKDNKDAEAKVYNKAIMRFDQQLDRIHELEKSLDKKTKAITPDILNLPKLGLRYKELGENKKQLFTTETLKDVTHINYGHTHVGAEKVEIRGLGRSKDEQDNGESDKKKDTVYDKTITVSNNASVTGAVMQRPLDENGNLRSFEKNEKPYTDIGNLSMLVYRVKDGKITEIKTAGRLIAEHIKEVKEMIADIPKPQTGPTSKKAPTPGAINPDNIIRKRGSGEREI